MTWNIGVPFECRSLCTESKNLKLLIIFILFLFESDDGGKIVINLRSNAIYYYILSMASGETERAKEKEWIKISRTLKFSIRKSICGTISFLKESSTHTSQDRALKRRKHFHGYILVRIETQSRWTSNYIRIINKGREKKQYCNLFWFITTDI